MTAMRREHLCSLLIACLVQGLTPVGAAEETEKKECPGSLWSLHFDGIQYEGRAILHVNLKNHLKVQGHSTAILSCVDMLVSGTGEKRLHMPPEASKTVKFNLSLQKPVKEEDFEKLERDSVHQCVLSLQLEPVVGRSGCDTPSVQEGCHHRTVEQECAINIRSFIGRILPHCGNTEEAKKLLLKVDILKEDGKVHVHMGTSPNDIFTYDPWCATDESSSPSSLLEHDTAANQERYTLALNEERSGPFILSVEFRPNCSDPAVNAEYQGVQMTGCRLGVYRYCQNGMDQVMEGDIEFSSKATYCYPLPSALDLALQQLKMHLGIDSIPVVAEIGWLVFNAALYLILIPLAILRCAVARRMRLRRLIPGVGIVCRHKSCNYQMTHDPQTESLLEAMKQASGDLLEEELSRQHKEEEADGMGGGGGGHREEQEAACEGQLIEVELHPQTTGEKQT